MVTTTETGTVRCWLCRKLVQVKWSTKGKPYLVCDVRNGGCGMQTFIREERAMRLLANKVKEEAGNE